ncbi:hypothetical protein [Streptomyces xantholiticus]|uniref:hypothetical protein n=1 Tax=Streptomyces xantholiticus TaxID=68285 RepID=UPI001679B264|nr:hypothetical protein [Streptomyces xantholiticus]GGW59378.1 hypothetical protein GCM10010381_50800 [Streptomyces xantholiticus]
MTVIRRLALYVALPLTLAAVTAYGWYQFSDTGRRWRYEDKLATYCQGLIPPKESAVFTDYDTDKALPHDEHVGGLDGYEFCWVGKTMLTIARIPASARDDDGPRGVFDELRPDRTGTLPMALGGGWHGYTNLESAAVVLDCGNQDASVVASAATVSRAGTGRTTAELLAATAVRAAEHWDCEAEAGGPIPRVPAEPEQKSRFEAKGTCAGFPMHDMDSIHWIKETPATASSLLEACVLGETKARSEELFQVRAYFGPFAQAQYPDDESTRDAGRHGQRFSWATARCPGTSARALFTISTTEYAHEDVGDFARSALTAFAKRSAAQHGCTDLELPR